jgi:hypothetical protein
MMFYNRRIFNLRDKYWVSQLNKITLHLFPTSTQQYKRNQNISNVDSDKITTNVMLYKGSPRFKVEFADHFAMKRKVEGVNIFPSEPILSVQTGRYAEDVFHVAPDFNSAAKFALFVQRNFHYSEYIDNSNNSNNNNNDDGIQHVNHSSNYSSNYSSNNNNHNNDSFNSLIGKYMTKLSTLVHHDDTKLGDIGQIQLIPNDNVRHFNLRDEKWHQFITLMVDCIKTKTDCEINHVCTHEDYQHRVLISFGQHYCFDVDIKLIDVYAKTSDDQFLTPTIFCKDPVLEVVFKGCSYCDNIHFNRWFYIGKNTTPSSHSFSSLKTWFEMLGDIIQCEKELYDQRLSRNSQQLSSTSSTNSSPSSSTTSSCCSCSTTSSDQDRRFSVESSSSIENEINVPTLEMPTTNPASTAVASTAVASAVASAASAVAAVTSSSTTRHKRTLSHNSVLSSIESEPVEKEEEKEEEGLRRSKRIRSSKKRLQG